MWYGNSCNSGAQHGDGVIISELKGYNRKNTSGAGCLCKALLSETRCPTKTALLSLVTRLISSNLVQFHQGHLFVTDDFYAAGGKVLSKKIPRNKLTPVHHPNRHYGSSARGKKKKKKMTRKRAKQEVARDSLLCLPDACALHRS